MKRKSILLLIALMLCSLVIAACGKSKDTYSVTVQGATGGTIEASTSLVEKGGAVTFTVRPDLGYYLEWVKVNDKEVELTDDQDTFYVNNVKTDLTVTSSFRKGAYDIDIAPTSYGTVTASVNGAEYGETVTLTFAPATGYQVGTVVIGKASGGAVAYDAETKSFVMPNEDVSVVVTFVKVQVATPVLVFDYENHKVTWAAVENAEGYEYTLNGGVVQSTSDTFITLTQSGTYTVMVKALGNGETNFDSDWVTFVADNRMPIAEPVVSVVDNMTTAFEISWTAVDGASGYAYKWIIDSEEDYEWSNTTETSLTFAYPETVGNYGIVIKAVGDDLHLDSQSVHSTFLIYAPDIVGTVEDVVVPYTDVAVDYTLNVAALSDGTTANITLTKYHIYAYIDPTYANYKKAGYPDETYGDNGFTAGVYASTITAGASQQITLAADSGYLLEYNLTNHFGFTKKVQQWIMVQNDDSIDLLGDDYYPTLYSDSDFIGVLHFTVVENPGYKLLGDGEVLRLKSDGSTVYANGTLVNPVSLGNGEKLSFWVYNNSDFDTHFAFNGSGYIKIKAKSYFYWNLGENDPAAKVNYRTADGKLGKVTQWYEGRPIIEIDARDMETGALQPYEFFIGGFRIEKTAFALSTPVVTVENNKLTWDAVANATGYEVSLNGGESWTAVSACEYAPENTGTIVDVLVRALGQKPFTVSESASAQVDFRPKTTAPTNVTVTKNTSDYTFGWTAVLDATSYKYRVIGVDGKPVTDWNSTTATSVTVNSSVYGSSAGELTVQVVACKEGNADSDYATAVLTLVAPSFTSVPQDMLIQLGADTGSMTIGGTGEINSALATATGADVSWTIKLRYLVNVGAFMAGDEHALPASMTPNMTSVTLYNQFYLDIEWRATDAYGVSAVHHQYVLCPSSAPLKTEEISNAYADFYTKDGVLSGDGVLTTETASGYKLSEKQNASVVRVQSATGNAVATLSNNVFVGKQSERPVSVLTFNVYNNSDEDVSLSITAGDVSTFMTVRAKSYGNYYFYHNFAGSLYAHKKIGEDGKLADVAFTANAANGGAVDLYIGELMIDKGFYALAAPALSAEDKTITWTAVKGATKYMVSIDGGLSWESQTATTYTVSGDAQTTVMVKAAAETLYQESEAASITVNKPVKLATPVLSADGKTVSWTAVDNATKYLVSVNGGSSWSEQTATSYTVQGDVQTTVLVKAVGIAPFAESEAASIVINQMSFTSIPMDVVYRMPTSTTVGGSNGAFIINPASTEGLAEGSYTVAPTALAGELTYQVKMLNLTGAAIGSLANFPQFGFPNGIHEAVEADRHTGIDVYEDFLYVIEWKLSQGTEFISHTQYIYPVAYDPIDSLSATYYTGATLGAGMTYETSPFGIFGEKALRITSDGSGYYIDAAITGTANIGAGGRILALVYNNSDVDVSFIMYGTAVGGPITVPAKTIASFTFYRTYTADVHGLADASGNTQTIRFQPATANSANAVIDVYVSLFAGVLPTA